MFLTKISFHWQAFIVHKNGEKLKVLIDIFLEKLTVSNAILAFLDHLKPKIFNHGGRYRARPSPFQNLWIRPWH